MPSHPPRPRVVLDSVVLVSAFLTRQGLANEVFRRSVQEATLYISTDILEEVRGVLLEREHIRKRYTYTPDQVEQFLEQVRTVAVVVSSPPLLKVIERDPKDDMILACAVGAQAQYLISRDPHLLDLKIYQKIAILSPEEFIKVLRASFS